MTEQEKQTLEAAKEFGVSDLTQDLVLIIERLDAENEKLKADLDRAVNAKDTRSFSEILGV